MKAKEKDYQLYLLKKVHNWCKQRDMLEPEMYYQRVFRDILRLTNMVLTNISTRNNQDGGHHTFTFKAIPGCSIYGITNGEAEGLFDHYYSEVDYFEYEDIEVIENGNGILRIRGHYPF